MTLNTFSSTKDLIEKQNVGPSGKWMNINPLTSFLSIDNNQICEITIFIMTNSVKALRSASIIKR